MVDGGELGPSPAAPGSVLPTQPQSVIQEVEVVRAELPLRHADHLTPARKGT